MLRMVNAEARPVIQRRDGSRVIAPRGLADDPAVVGWAVVMWIEINGEEREFMGAEIE